jgi:hypothetical protein
MKPDEKRQNIVMDTAVNPASSGNYASETEMTADRFLYKRTCRFSVLDGGRNLFVGLRGHSFPALTKSC